MTTAGDTRLDRPAAATTGPTAVGGPGRSRPRLLLAAARPRQWAKNALVLAPALAAGSWLRPGVLVGTAVATASFILVSSAVYLVNDLWDLPRDRVHPTKRLRPLASGRLPVRWARAAAVGAAAAGVVLALATDHEELAAVLTGYVAVSVAYSAGLKAVPALEVVLVAAGFVWRPLAGGAATGIPISGWFLEVCCLAALTVAVGKRLSELTLGDDVRVSHRPALAHYRPAALRAVRRLSSVAAVGCYLAWAVSRWQGPSRAVAVASALPLALTLYRYARCNDRGRGGAPEDLLLSDRALQVAGLVWLGLFVATSHV